MTPKVRVRIPTGPYIGCWCNGNTSDSKSENEGPIPSLPAHGIVAKRLNAPDCNSVRSGKQIVGSNPTDVSYSWVVGMNALDKTF